VRRRTEDDFRIKENTPMSQWRFFIGAIRAKVQPQKEVSNPAEFKNGETIAVDSLHRKYSECFVGRSGVESV